MLVDHRLALRGLPWKLWLKQIAAVLVVIGLTSPVWAFLAARARDGGEEYLLSKDGLGDWQIVAIRVGSSMRGYVQKWGKLPPTKAEAICAGILDLRRPGSTWPFRVPEEYRQSAWHYGLPRKGEVRATDVILRYHVPERRGAPALALEMRADLEWRYQFVGRWRPVWWWDILAPHGLAVFFGRKGYAR